MKKIVVGLVAFVVWVITNLSIEWIFGAFNFDTTSSKQYTLNNISVEAAKIINKPIKFKLYVSDNLSSYNLDAFNYANYVSAILGQYQKQNPQNISFEIIEIKPYSAEAKIAEIAGIKALPYNDEYVYFGLEINSDNEIRSIPELIIGRRAYFENDINRIIANLISENQTTVGIVSSDIPLFSNGTKQKVWSVTDEMMLDYKFVNISDRVAYIPTEVKLLIVLNPTNYPELFVYAIDQYLMRGGKLIIFVDPYSEISHYYKGFPPTSKTNIDGLIRSWGIDYDNNIAIGNLGQSLKIAGGIDYPLWFFTENNKYKKLHFRSPGHLNIIPREDLRYEVLVSSPKDSGIIDSNKMRYATKKSIAEHFENKKQIYNLAVKIKGTFISNYDKGFFDGTKHEKDIPPYEVLSNDNAEVVIIADSDFMSDDTWALSQDKNNRVYGTEPYADNGEFILSTINNLLKDENHHIKNSQPKYIDIMDITTKISKPIIEDSETRKRELTENYNKVQKQLDEAKFSMMTADAGTKIMYRQQIEKLQTEAQQYASELDKINAQIGYQTEKAINKLMLSNLLYYPLIILVVIGLLCYFLRNKNLKRIK
ncbi:MAG: GldG family protein [Alphaproteobacteria bacterium]|nr:GldG family protein [Alphaproteobacteria bacterium]